MGSTLPPTNVMASYIAALGGRNNCLLVAVGDSRLANEFFYYAVSCSGATASYGPDSVSLTAGSL